MKRMLLVSNFKNTAAIFNQMEKDLKGKTITYIPTAAKAEKVSLFSEITKQKLESLGLIVDELDVSAAPIEDIKHKLGANDYIFIGGGNTFYLLQELKRTGADKLITDEIENGKLYIGESAGAIIAAPDIEYIKYMDNIKKAPKLKEFQGLKLVDFYIVPHENAFGFKKAVRKIKKEYSQKLNLYVINNNQAIIIKDDEIKLSE